MAGHTSVLLAETLRLLQPERGGRYLDATFGGGGHTRAILESNLQTQVMGLDRDEAAIARAESLAKDFPERFSFKSMNFASMEALSLSYHGSFRGILFDLGVSSYQLDEAERGFSFRSDADVDMRMDVREGVPAYDFLECATEGELIRAIRDYGEEPRYKRVVSAILGARGTGQLRRTSSLAELIARALGPAARHSRIHPATLSFQGIRIAINGELEAIEHALPAAFSMLEQGGVLAVISFHSLEDRIIKRYFRRLAGMPEHEHDSRSQMDRTSVATLLTRRPVVPSEQEQKENPRSRSAKLRAIVKI